MDKESMDAHRAANAAVQAVLKKIKTNNFPRMHELMQELANTKVPLAKAEPEVKDAFIRSMNRMKAMAEALKDAAEGRGKAKGSP